VAALVAAGSTPCKIKPLISAVSVASPALILLVIADQKVIDDLHYITPRRGNGQLRREVWVNSDGHVTRYNLAYINHALHGGDNGRVVGYDN